MRSALVTAITTDARVARWRLDPPALLTREDQPAVAASRPPETRLAVAA